MRRRGNGSREPSYDEQGLRSLADRMADRTDLIASRPVDPRRSADRRDASPNGGGGRVPGGPPGRPPGGPPGRPPGRPPLGGPGSDLPDGSFPDDGAVYGQEVGTYAGLAALGEEIDHRPEPGRADRRRKTARSRRRRRVKRGVLIGVVALVVLIAGVAGYAYYLTHDLHREEVKGLHNSFTAGAEAGTENILMVGSTSRCALKVQNPAYGLCSQGVNGVNSDVMMILHADPSHHKLALLSIPRDLFVPNARTTGANKIDAGLVEGISQVVASIEQDFGIPIQHAVSLNFDQFANIVDALGGINMSFPESVFDAESGLNEQAAACVHLNGTQALQVVRARHLQYKGSSTNPNARTWTQEAQSDLARIRRDHEFLRVLASAASKKGLDNPISDISLINSVKNDITFDQSWSVHDMANLLLTFHGVDINSVPQLTLPVSVVLDPAGGSSGDYLYKGGNYQEVEFTAPDDQSVIDQVLGITPGTDSMTGNPLPAPSTVSVSVLNGTGVTQQAADTSAALGALGFHMVGASDATPVGDVSETVVYYGSHAPAVQAKAQAVARSMTGSVIMGYNPAAVTTGADVTVVTGSQFSVNPPASTGGAASSGGASGGSTATTAPSSTTATTSAAARAIGTPSTPSNNLEPWDPRSCKPRVQPTAPVANQT